MQVEFPDLIRYRFPIFILFCAAWFGVAGCHRPPSADVVATVNGKEILRADLDRAFQATLGEGQPQLPAVEADIRRLQVLRSLIDDEILQQRAAKLNLTASEEDVNAKLTEIKAPYTQDQFDKMLKQQNMTLDDLKRQVRRQLTRDKVLNKEIEAKINITDAEIRDYYLAHKSDFNLVEPRYHLARIRVDATPQRPQSMPTSAPAETDPKKRIDTALNRLQSGEDFGAVASEFSDDPNTATSNGDMGFVMDSQLKSDPQIYDAITKLKQDQFTPVLPMYGGSGPAHKIVEFDIFKLISREPPGQRELSDPRVQQYIHQLMHDNQKQVLQNAYLETLQDEAKVRNYFAEQILKQGGASVQ